MGREVFSCFRWSGHRNLLSDVAARCRHDLMLPPVSVRLWTFKPPKLCKVSYSIQANALRWMWDEMNDIAEQIQRRFPHHVPDIHRQYRTVAAELNHDDMACQWSTERPDGVVEIVAIVSWLDDGSLTSTNRQEEVPRPSAASIARSRWVSRRANRKDSTTQWRKP